MAIIETGRLILRNWKEEDSIPFIEMCADPDVMAFMPNLLSKEETRLLIGRIKDHFSKYGFGLYAVEKKDGGYFIGFTGLMFPSFEHFFTPCVEIGWRLKSSEWNKGYATEAAAACLNYGFSKLSLERIYSFTSIHNLASQRVMQKTGMKRLENFNHPLIAPGHYLSEHVLYVIENKTQMENHLG